MRYVRDMPAARSTCRLTLLRGTAAITLLTGLACGGLMPVEKGELRGIQPNPDATDRAERARLNKDYQRAEAMLKDRLKDDPDDHHAWRLLGDVNLTRGQDYRKRWKENLVKAYDSYAQAVSLKPDDCSYWARLAAVVTMSYPAEGTRIDGATLEKLPIAKGWEHCAGPALVELELRRDPAPEVLEKYLEENRNADRWAQMKDLQPWVKDAWERVPLGQVSWIEDPTPVPLVAGLPFVVVQPPLQARGVGHEYHRGVNGLERFVTNRVSGDRVIFTDRRFPEKIPEKATVKAGACQYTTWKDDKTTGKAIGNCSTGAFLRGRSALYASSMLQSAGPGHYEHTSIAPAQIPGEEVLWDSVRCIGGPIGKKFEYTPTCKVEYDKPNWLQRSLPVDKVLGTRGDAHAEQILEAARMREIWGDELTERMIRGDIGVGMPYSVFRYAMTDLTGCQGRALLTSHLINGGEMEWTCFAGEDGKDAYTFVDLQLAWIGKKDEYLASMAPPPPEE